MSIDKEKSKQILLKAVSLEKGKEIALAKEFIGIEDNINSLKETINALGTKVDEPLEVELVIE